MYQNHVRKIKPGLLVIVIDQSEVMSDPMPNGNGTMADIATICINQLIEELEYYYSYEDGYGNEVGDIRAIKLFVVGHGRGKAHIIQQDWIHDGCCGGVHMVPPVAEGMQAMYSAFNFVKEELALWTKMYSGLDDVVPLVINVTTSGNISNDTSMRTIIKDIMGIQMPDGSPIMYNIHVTSQNKVPIIYFPNVEVQLPDAFSKLLYWSSSGINKDLKSRTPKFFSKNYCSDGSKLFVYNLTNPQSFYKVLSFAIEYFCTNKPRFKSL